MLIWFLLKVFMNYVVLKSCFGQSLRVLIGGLGSGGHGIFCCCEHRISSFDRISFACKVPNRQNSAKAERTQQAKCFPGILCALLIKGALWLRRIQKAKGVFCLREYPLLLLCACRLKLPGSVEQRLPHQCSLQKGSWNSLKGLQFIFLKQAKAQSCCDTGGCWKPRSRQDWAKLLQWIWQHFCFSVGC